ncbi:MAG TPA: GAF domain-containing SpoIIE family protein phosphatase, partial [Yinghuangia sp.]|nr:GAF domain-containing SpoIIE family protein phosphatase [Yinghuangia sp.]
YEDRYRAAVMSREPVSMTAFRPPDHWLRFDLYPGGAGISVRIHREEGSGPDTTPPPGRKTGAGTPPGAGQAYRLVHFAAVLTEAVSVDDVVARVADEVLPAFHAQGVAIVAFESGRLRVLGHRGYPPGAVDSFDGTPLDAIPSAALRIFTSAVPTFFASAQEMQRVYPDLPAHARSPQARAVLPLIVSGRPIGACMLAYDRPHTFEVAERSVLTALAGVLAQALDRARLFDAKHQIAHGLQQALLPRALPDVPGLRVHARYLPATERMDIGGDFYDLIGLGPAGAGALIGDVQGHNIAAAALMGQVRTAIHAHAAAGSPPDDVLARTNRLLTDLGTNLFTTCLHVHLDPATGRARLANAGHPPPILCLPGRTAASVLDVTPGPPLGIDPDAAYPVTDTILPPHAILLLYTDGLVETPDTDLDHAISALARSLPHTGRPALEHLADTALTHPATGRRTDDTALLLLQLLPPTD